MQSEKRKEEEETYQAVLFEEGKEECYLRMLFFFGSKVEHLWMPEERKRAKPEHGSSTLFLP